MKKNLLFFLILSIPLNIFADVINELKEMNVFYDQNDSNLHPCNQLESMPIGSYYFTQSNNKNNLNLCYKDSKNTTHLKSVLIKKNKIKSKYDLLYRDILSFLKKNKNLKTSFLDQKQKKDISCISEILATTHPIATGSSCPSNLPKCEMYKKDKNKLMTNGSLTVSDDTSDPKQLLGKKEIKNCEITFKEKGIVQKELIAKGSYGSISGVCLIGEINEDCGWVEKTTVISSSDVINEDRLNDFIKESSIFKNLQPGVAPEIIDSYFCKEGNNILGKFIVKKMDGDLYHYLMTNTISEEDLVKIFNLTRRLHESDIVHQDLHTKNILYKKEENGSVSFYITDFGLSYQYGSKGPNEKSPKVMNFRLGGGGGTIERQKKYDIESLLTDLKDKFDIEVIVDLNNELIRPKDLPNQAKGNLKTIRQIMIDETKDKIFSKEDKIIIQVPWRNIPLVRPYDPILLGPESGKALDENSKLKNIKISLP